MVMNTMPDLIGATIPRVTLPEITIDRDVMIPLSAERSLGANEISGIGMRYRIGSDQNEVFMPGAFQECDGLKIPFAFEHKTPIGIAVLKDTPEGVIFKARVLGSRLLVVQLWLLWQVGAFRQLCLSSAPLETSNAVGPNGERVTLIHRARASELSAVLCAGIPGCVISEIGQLSQQEDEFDRELLTGNFLERVQAELAGDWLKWCKRQLSNNSKGDPDASSIKV